MESFEIVNKLNEKWQSEFPSLVRIEFSEWILWNRRNTLNNIKKTGVYTLGKFDLNKRGSVDLLDERIIYFGKTNLGKTTSLLNRLNAFEGAAFSNGAPHAGGYNYKRRYGSDKSGLHVAICPIYWTGEDALSDFAQFAVSQAITRLEVCLRGIYVYTWGRLPSCNKE